MDDIIVFILTLIFIAAGIFGQMKKRQLPPEPTGETPPPDNPVWGSLEYDEEDDEPIGVSNQKNLPEEGGRGDRFHTAASFMKRDFSQGRVRETPKVETITRQKKKSFPLKKAVIYSEILNRKYF